MGNYTTVLGGLAFISIGACAVETLTPIPLDDPTGAGGSGVAVASVGGSGGSEDASRGEPGDFPTECTESCEEACASIDACGASDSSAYEAGTRDLHELARRGDFPSPRLDRAHARATLVGVGRSPIIDEFRIEAAYGDGLEIVLSGRDEDLDFEVVEDVHLDLSARYLGILAHVFDWTIPDLGRLEVSGLVSKRGDQLIARGLDAKLGDSHLKGDLTIEPTRRPRPLVKAQLRAPTFHLTDLGLSPATSDERETDEDGPSRAERWLSTEKLPFDDLELADIELGLTVDEFIGEDGFRLRDVSLRMDVEDGVLETHGLELEWQSGAIWAKGIIDARSRPPRLMLRARGTGIDVDAVTSQLSTKPTATGEGELSLVLRTEGDTRRELWSALEGNVFVGMIDGELATRYSRALQLDVLQGIDPRRPLPEMEPVVCLISDLSIQGGRFDIESMLVDTEEKQVVTRGHLDVPDWRLDLVVSPAFKVFIPGSVTGAVRVTGRLDQPTVSPEPFATASTATRGVLERATRPLVRLWPELGEFVDEARRGAGRGARSMGVPSMGGLWKPGADLNCDMLLEQERIVRARALGPAAAADSVDAE